MSKRDLEAMADKIRRLRRDCAEAYQVMGAGFCIGAAYRAADVERALDNLNAAAQDKPRPHDDLLPWPKPGKGSRRKGTSR